MSTEPPALRDPGTGLAAAVRRVLVLGVIVLVAGLLAACAFVPGAPEVDRDAVPRIDVASRLRDAASGTPFALRVPTLPPDWIAQSSDVRVLGPSSDGAAARAVRVGWLTPENEFARLVQSSGDEASTVVAEQGDPTATGTVAAAGRTWVTHHGRRDEQVWVTDVGGVRLLITGSAPPARFAQLAEATLAAPFAR